MTARGQGARRTHGQRGYAMAALLVGIAVMGILLSVAMPVWRNTIKRENEAELIFRGEQYARAVGLFQRKHAGAFPPSVELLVEQRFLRRRYKDPMSGDGEFQILYQAAAASQPGQVAGASRPGTSTPAQPAPQVSVFGASVTGPRGGILGVVSKSREKAMRLYRGRSHYNEWQFVYTAVSTGAGAPASAPGQPGRPAPGGVPGQPRPGTPTPGGMPRTGVPPGEQP